MNDTAGARRRLFLKGSIAAGAALALPMAGASAAPTADLPLYPGMLDWKPVKATDTLLLTYVWDLFRGFETVEVALDTWSEPLNMGERGTFHVRIAYTGFDKRFGPTFRTALADARKNELEAINLGNGATGGFLKQGVAVSVRHMLASADLGRVANAWTS
ncbi:hypothetical protein KPL74_10860 [Bacillus sp. NP157]|nr:hypothetical protein KPL74_10860 [Bacillus sp. NP157]